MMPACPSARLRIAALARCTRRRGAGPSLTEITHQRCSGRADLVLYRGKCARISRISRNSAANSLGVSSHSRLAVSRSIRAWRCSGHGNRKYERSRVRSCVLLPTYSTSPCAPRMRYTPVTLRAPARTWSRSRPTSALDEPTARSSCSAAMAVVPRGLVDRICAECAVVGDRSVLAGGTKDTAASVDRMRTHETTPAPSARGPRAAVRGQLFDVASTLTVSIPVVAKTGTSRRD